MGCMSPLYATPPLSPISDTNLPNFEDHFEAPSAIFAPQPDNDHFARDTHMRIILGNSKESNQASKWVWCLDGTECKLSCGHDALLSAHFVYRFCHIFGTIIHILFSFSRKSSKRSGITTNPAVRLLRNRFDSAAQLIRRTNNMLTSSSSYNHQEGSSSIAIKSGTFQWRKESQM